MVILDLNCIEAKSFYFSCNFFVVTHKNLLRLYIVQPAHLHPPASQNVESLSPCLLGLSGRHISGSWKGEAGWQWLARKRSRQRRGLRSGWDLCYWRWCIYLRTRVNSNSWQNGELKHRLQNMLWYLKLRRRLLEDKVAWVDYEESHRQSST